MRKKGNVFLLSLMSFMMIFVLAMVIFNVLVVGNSLGKVKGAIHEGARVRAQAVDIPLKEYTGNIEVMHPIESINKDGFGVLYDGTGVDQSFHDAVEVKMRVDKAAGHAPIYHPYKEWDRYKVSVEHAELAARTVVVNAVDYLVGKDVFGNRLATVEAENICFDIKPLPPTKATVTFSCKTEKFGLVTRTLWVDGQDEHTYGDPAMGQMKVKNVVFAAVSFEYQLLLTKPMVRLGWNGAPIKTYYAISYPQVDKCYGAHC